MTESFDVTRAAFWIDLVERTVRAFAQGTLAGLATLKIGTNVAPGTSIPWLDACEFGAATAAMALLSGLAAMRVGDRASTSFLPPPQQKVAAARALGARVRRRL